MKKLVLSSAAAVAAVGLLPGGGAAADPTKAKGDETFELDCDNGRSYSVVVKVVRVTPARP